MNEEIVERQKKRKGFENFEAACNNILDLHKKDFKLPDINRVASYEIYKIADKISKNLAEKIKKHIENEGGLISNIDNLASIDDFKKEKEKLENLKKYFQSKKTEKKDIDLMTRMTEPLVRAVPQLYKISSQSQCEVINGFDILEQYTRDFIFVHINADKSNSEKLNNELKKENNLSKASIIFISETVNYKANDSWSRDFSYFPTLENQQFSTIFDEKNPPKNGGVGMLIRKDKFNILNPEHLQIEDLELMEKVFVKNLPLANSDHLWIKLSILNIVVGVVYRRPRDTNEEYNKFAVDFVRIIHKLINSGLTFYIFGDFNIDLLENNIFNKCFCYSLCSLGCKQLINKPTRYDQKKAGTKNVADKGENTSEALTLIDHIYTNDTKIPDKTGIIISDISDHYPTFCTFKQKEVPKLEDILQGLFLTK